MADISKITTLDGTTYNIKDATARTSFYGFAYGTCGTAATTAAKAVTITNYTLSEGSICSIKFTNAVPANATLNINSKGAKSIYYKGAAITAGVIKAGDTATFIYSTRYHLISIDRIATDYYNKTEIDTMLGDVETLLASI